MTSISVKAASVAAGVVVLAFLVLPSRDTTLAQSSNSVGGQAIARLSPERRTLAQREQLSGWFLQFGIGRMDLPKEKLDEIRK